MGHDRYLSIERCWTTGVFKVVTRLVVVNHNHAFLAGGGIGGTGAGRHRTNDSPTVSPSEGHTSVGEKTTMGKLLSIQPEPNPERDRRMSMMRLIDYEMIESGQSSDGCNKGEAILVNLGRGGMLLLLDREFPVDRVLRVAMLTPIPQVTIPTMVDVRWTRKAPQSVAKDKPFYFVGVRFLLL